MYSAVLTPSDSVLDDPPDGYTKWNGSSWQNLTDGYWDSTKHQPLVVIQAQQSNSNTITIHFVNQNGQFVGQTPTQHGNIGGSLSIGPNDPIIENDMPQGYHYDAEHNFQLETSYTGNPQDLDIMVAGNKVSTTIPVTLHLKNADGHESTQQITVPDRNHEVGNVNNYYGHDYTPGASASGDVYTLDTSHYHPYSMRVLMSPDGKYTILNNVNSNGDPIPDVESRAGQFWYQTVPATVRVIFLDQHGQQVGQPLYRHGGVGQRFNLLGNKNDNTQRTYADATDYQLASDQDQYYHYALHPGAHTVYVHLIGNPNQRASAVTVNCLLQQSDGRYL